MCYGKWGTWTLSAAYTVVPTYLMFVRNAGILCPISFKLFDVHETQKIST